MPLVCALYALVRQCTMSSMPKTARSLLLGPASRTQLFYSLPPSVAKPHAGRRRTSPAHCENAAIWLAVSCCTVWRRQSRSMCRCKSPNWFARHFCEY